MIKALDKLAAFEDFQSSVLPVMRKDLASGMTADQLNEKYLALMTARKLTLGIASPTEATILAVAKDVEDRRLGKATEKKEITHRLAKLPEEQLDALLLTELSDMETNDNGKE